MSSSAKCSLSDLSIENKTENVRVFVRVRPLSLREELEKHQEIICIDEEENVISLNHPKQLKLPHKSFKFDHIFPYSCTQVDLYQKVALPIVEQVFRGYNGTILAYGQTGSGKTYTMSGNNDRNESKGILPNTFNHMFSQILRASSKKSFAVTATYIEIYNEEIHDLLSVRPDEKLEVRERVDVGVYVKGLTGFTVDSFEGVNELIELGNANRKTRATLMNNVSSRSHAIFTITVEAKDRETNKTTVAKLNLVDLAGSERLKRTQATGVGLKEASNINQSLFVLSNVISALVEDKSVHIPYRNSKLTRLLQDSLGGNSKTAMIATISPSESDYEESLCTLRYASRAKLIKNHVKLNLQFNEGLIEHFEKEISALQQRLAVILWSEEAKQSKSRKNTALLQKRKEFNEEFLNVESEKRDLKEKIEVIQHKILIGGQNLFDKAQQQEFLLESSTEEIQKLERSHQELQGILHKKETEIIDLQEQYSSVQEEDSKLDEKIEKVQRMLQEVQGIHDDEHQEFDHELNLLLEHNQLLNRELQLTEQIIKSSVPKCLLKKIEANIFWNTETCDFQIKGIAYVGNNMMKPKRRFTRHIPKYALMGTLFNERKNLLRSGDAILKKASTNSAYYHYLDKMEQFRKGE